MTYGVIGPDVPDLLVLGDRSDEVFELRQAAGEEVVVCVDPLDRCSIPKGVDKVHHGLGRANGICAAVNEHARDGARSQLVVSGVVRRKSDRKHPLCLWLRLSQA